MRLQLALNVRDIDEAVSFYGKLFGAEPHKRRPGYANFAIEMPPLKLGCSSRTRRPRSVCTIWAWKSWKRAVSPRLTAASRTPAFSTRCSWTRPAATRPRTSSGPGSLRDCAGSGTASPTTR